MGGGWRSKGRRGGKEGEGAERGMGRGQRGVSGLYCDVETLELIFND